MEVNIERKNMEELHQYWDLIRRSVRTLANNEAVRGNVAAREEVCSLLVKIMAAEGGHYFLKGWFKILC